MKIAVLILANIAIVAGGIVTYDALKSADSGVPADVAAMDRLGARLDSLEKRIDKLGADDGERRTTNRLLQVEGRVADLEARRMTAATAATSGPEDPHAAPEVVAVGVATDVVGLLNTADDETLAAVLEKMDAVRERQRSSEMVTRMTDRLGLTLTDEQRDRVATAMGDFRNNMRQKFREAREEGLGREAFPAVMEEARGELTTSLAEFLPQADAESIAATVGDFGGGGPGRGRGGGGGRPR